MAKRLDDRERALRAIPEKEFMAGVKRAARDLGWLTYHNLDARGSDAGFPDMVLVRRERLVFVECKRRNTKLRPEQEKWLEALSKADAETYVWRPGDEWAQYLA